jgi:hypothetical protein
MDSIIDIDTMLVMRILDAGGVVTGKAACDNTCLGAVRFVICFDWKIPADS